MSKKLFQTLDSMHARDPASRGRLEVALFNAGFHALLFHTWSHRLWKHKWTLLARWVSALGRWLTGVEIHPAAKIGQRLFIDHGMGVVIGETAEIGDDVTLYHGVTLGGISPSEKSHLQRGVKRHPTLRNGVIVGSGAQILGPITIGRKARVGANSVVTKDVREGLTMVGVPAREVLSRRQSGDGTAEKETPRTNCFMAYGTPLGDQEDAFSLTQESMLQEIQSLRARIHALERQMEQHSCKSAFKSHVDLAPSAETSAPDTSSSSPWFSVK